MAVTEQQVIAVAQLARLVINDAWRPEIVSQLNRILEHMDVLQSVVIPFIASDVNATPSHGQRPLPLREDVNTPVLLQATHSSFAPAFRDGFFLVPRLTTHADTTDE